MATVDRPRSKRQAIAPRPERVKRKSHAFRYGVLLTLALVLLGLYFAPPIVARTPLAEWLIESALKLDGSVSLGSASLGWLSSVEAHDLAIRDREGQPVLEVASLRTEKSLLGILLDFSDLGRVYIDRPVVRVVAGETDTNLEQIFGALLTGEGGAQIAIQLQIIDGSITINDIPTTRQFHIEKLALDCAIAGADQPLMLVVSGALPREKRPASFKIDLRTQASADSRSAVAHGKVDCQTSALPIELIEPVLRRYVKQARLTGKLSTRLGGAWGNMAEGGATSVSGESLITELAFSAAALGTDTIELDRIEIPCRVAQAGDLVQVEQLALNCELGQVSLVGSVKMSDFSADDMLAALARENYELKGHADLAQLALRLPHTLKIREGTKITSGEVDLVVSSRQQPEGIAWSGTVEAKQLGAQADGRALTWTNPLSLEFATHETKHGFVLDRAQCTSSFLQIDGRGSIDDLAASASFDLARLVQELRQFSDLGGVQLAGRGQAQLAWKRQAGDQFDARGEFQAQGFQFIAAGGQAWRENKVVAKLDLGGLLSDHSVKRVERAELTVETGGDRLQARLQEPISDPGKAAWPVQCSWQGPLAAWSPRLESCAGLTGWNLAGNGALQATLRCTSQAVEVQAAKVDCAQLRAWGHGWFVSEPSLALAAEGRWDFAKARIEADQVRLSAGSTQATVSRAVLQATNGGWSLDGGTAQVVADLAQWHRWQHDPRTQAGWQVAGRLNAEAELKHESEVTTGRVDATIDQLQLVELARASTPGAAPATWRERQITLAVRGDYQHRAEQLKLDKIQIASDALRGDASGVFPLSTAGGNVDLKGTVQYDWNQLAPLWRPYLGQGVQIAGRQTRSFAIAGRLAGPPIESDSWRQVVGEAAVGWTGMDVYALRVGAGEVAAKLAEGQLRGQPMDVQVSEGRFTFTPFVRLTPAPAELLIARGPLLTEVHLSPEMCARGLKFVAPILAESTVAEGRFSVSLDGGRIPLADPGAGDTSGRMAMKAQVKAGPVGQEFMVLINEISSLLQRGALVARNEQVSSLVSVDSADIEFRLVNRRVYHRGFKFVVGTLPITTHGSVGLDESLSLVAEVPIQAKLLGRDLSLGALEGQTLQIPIEGTLKKPRLDRRILQQLGGQLLQNAARGALIDEVNKQLDRLLPFQP